MSLVFRWMVIPEEFVPQTNTDQSNVNSERTDKSFPIYDPSKEKFPTDETREILENIKKINSGLKKPYREQINLNKNIPDKSYVLDEETLKKIQMLITTGKLQALSETPQLQDNNALSNEHLDYLRDGNPRALQYRPIEQKSRKEPMVLLPIPLSSLRQSMMLVPGNELYNTYNQVAHNDLDSFDSQYFSRQGLPSLPFAIPWPFSGYFPILIKDPLLNYLQGGNWNSLIDVGQAADVCNRKQKSSDTEETIINSIDDGNPKHMEDKSIDLNPLIAYLAREGRKIKKRTIPNDAPQQQIKTKVTKDSKKFFGNKNKVVTKKPVPQQEPLYEEDDEIDDTKNSAATGDLRFPFGDFTLFGNRKPVAPSPGFFINRLKVRRGGVAIAGPGGVATAGRGGAAIVGPGGLAYTQPGGMAIAGPAAKVYALSPDVDLNQVIAQLQKKTANDGTLPRSHVVEGGRLVAIGPIIYFNKNDTRLL